MTTRYFAHLVQRDEGCDYAISCAEALVTLRSTNWQDAQAELQSLVLRQYIGESTLKGVLLIEVSKAHEMPVNDWYTCEESRVKELRAQEAEQTERTEYERLKTKFG